jgi:hypothetical protein
LSYLISSSLAQQAGPPLRMKIQGWRKRAETVESRHKLELSKITDPSLQPLCGEAGPVPVLHLAKIIWVRLFYNDE